ncbi:hypothetical protein GCM10023084_80060 [Streptomyces lacrimifluminis]|uniref:Uncharacterized protein n=1 Tax=Streptomyces lacrimifluminis TaxID=1500077 RepID=A0A917PCM8_9ACTN|nr:hypothetical protein [Streptomyces lacrimifluminis]GGJ70734.1 hypothetical protein GCM10012282_79480 [Streptomyces lacrimifluminis]
MGNTLGKDFEAQVREMMTEDAYTIRPSSAPYTAIRRKGTIERRRRVAAAGAILVALAAAPVAAYAVNGNGGDGSVNTAAPLPSTGTSARTTPTPVQSAPAGPAGPATPGQLRDGITLAQASDGLEKCIAWNRENDKNRSSKAPPLTELGEATDYRIILALNSTGDSNSPGDGFHVVAVKEQTKQPKLTQLICTIKDGESSGINISTGGLEFDNGGPVMPDINAGKLYQQSFIDKGNWKLPFGWGSIGRIDPSVTRVTVSYGGSTSEAALDHGWFVATGTLNKQVTLAPHVKAYDSTGKTVYDSDNDAGYDKALP